MPVTMQQVLNQLEREEPDYVQAAKLGAEALPHILALLQETRPGIAAKAAFLAGAINAEGSGAVLVIAARHPEPVVRVAAAATARNLSRVSTDLALAFLNDTDNGVRRWAMKSLETQTVPGIRAKLEDLMQHDPDPSLRDSARRLVDRLGQTRIRIPVREQVREQVPGTRVERRLHARGMAVVAAWRKPRERGHRARCRDQRDHCVQIARRHVQRDAQIRVDDQRTR